MSSRPSEPRAGGGAARGVAGPRATGAVLLGIGVVALVATFSIRGGRDPWALTGPRLFPLIASIALIVLSGAFLVRTWVAPDAELSAFAAREAADTEWRVPVLVGIALLAYAELMEPVGYLLSSAAFFPVVARILGSRALVRDVVAGAALSLGVYVLFTQALAVPLPIGILGF
jgi:putative tricarboxylic transport membrane protein